MKGSRTRAAFVAAATTAGAFALMAQSASAGILAPESSASDGASSARTLYLVMAIIGVLILVAVFAALARALRSKAAGGDVEERRTRGTDAVQLRVGIGLAAATMALFVVGIIFTVQTNEVDAADGAEPITIQVDAQQWLWRYAYPPPEESPDGFVSDQPYSYQRLVVPVDTPITLDVSSIDVMHRWSVPALAPAVDAVPGATNQVSFKATEIGTYEGASMRFSGPGYSAMRTVVDVVSQDEYEDFLDDKVAAIKEARSAVQERIEEGTAPGVEFEE